MTDRRKHISVIGGGECTPEQYRQAEEVGREIARRDAVLICGGLSGVMEAACKGAATEGGITIGILPGRYRDDANEYVQIPIATGLGEGRNAIVVKSGHAVIAVDGSYGTLTEIGLALRAGIPVIGLDTWTLVKDGITDRSIIIAENPTDAVNKAFDAIE